MAHVKGTGENILQLLYFDESIAQKQKIKARGDAACTCHKDYLIHLVATIVYIIDRSSWMI